MKVMLDKEIDPAKASSLELIYRNAKRLLDLVNKTLDLHMIESMKKIVGEEKTETREDADLEGESKQNLAVCSHR